MRPEALLESNQSFFRNDLVLNCLLPDLLADFCRDVVDRPFLYDESGGDVEDSEFDTGGILQLAFQCSDGVYTELKFSIEVATMIAKRHVVPSLCVPIIQNVELTGRGDRLEFCLDGYLISFTITGYMVEMNLWFVHECTDPVCECSRDDAHLGRTVLLEMRKLED